jgi:hypothetical protein
MPVLSLSEEEQLSIDSAEEVAAGVFVDIGTQPSIAITMSGGGVLVLVQTKWKKQSAAKLKVMNSPTPIDEKPATDPDTYSIRCRGPWNSRHHNT